MASGELSETELSSIARKLSEQLTANKRAFWVDPEIHAQHHEWVKQRKQDEDDLRSFRQKVIQSAILYAVPLALAFVALASWKAIVAAIQANGIIGP